MAISARTYQRRIQRLRRTITDLRQTIVDIQWVQPSYNGAPSCAGCGAMRHHGCYKGCAAAAITGDRGRPEHGVPLPEE